MERSQLTKIVILSLTAVFGLSHAKSEASEATEFNELWVQAKSGYQKTSQLIETAPRMSDVSSLLGQKCQSEQLTGHLAQFLLDEADYWDQNYGLELRAGVTSGDLDSSDIDRSASSYVELSWDVLANGYKENNYRAFDLRRRAALEKIETEFENHTIEHRCRELRLHQHFAQLEFMMAQQIFALMEGIYDIEQSAYMDGNSYYDELLISEEALVKMEYRLKYLTRFISDHRAIERLPSIFDLDINAIIHLAQQDSRANELRQLRRSRIAEDNPYDEGTRLRLFVRKELDLFQSDRDDLLAGARLSMPFSFSERPSYEARLNAFEREGEIADWEHVSRIKHAYHLFNNQLERSLAQQFRYLRAKERVRRVLSHRAMGKDIRLSAAMVRVKGFLESALELVESNRQLYERANQVFLTARIDYSPNYIQLHNSDKTFDRLRPFHRALYIWSDGFNSITNQQLNLILQTQNIDRPIISFSKNTDHDKLNEFLIQAREQGSKVELIMGDNSWVHPQNWDKAAAIIGAQSRNTEIIHLDIEPQTFADYASRRDVYQQEYVNMLRSIRKANPDIELSVSVPFHWTADTYQDLAPLVDRVYLMNYENTKLDKLVERTKRVLQHLPLERLVVALRPKDFASTYQFEQTVNALHQATGVEAFALHKMSDLFAAEGF